MQALALHKGICKPILRCLDAAELWRWQIRQQANAQAELSSSAHLVSAHYTNSPPAADRISTLHILIQLTNFLVSLFAGGISSDFPRKSDLPCPAFIIGAAGFTVLRVLEVTDIWDSLSVIDETFCIAPRPVSGKLRECLSTGFPTIPRKEVSKNQNPNFMQGIG